MSEKNGGSAFPEIDSYPAWDHDSERNYTRTHSVGGMTLRDYFAGQALMALIMVIDGALDVDPHAVRAYEYADAMLKEREK